jgi:GT2 family glycosyltransferase
MTAPAVSVQIVTWNSADVIEPCLASLAVQRSRAFEVVVVDNASTDGSAEKVDGWRPRLPDLNLVRLDDNRGFCGGQNRATVASVAPWILFLNPDTVLGDDFIERAIAVTGAAARRVGAIAPCILLPDGRVDSTGLAMDRFRRAYDRDRGASPRRRYAADPTVLGCTGAVALLRRAMLQDVAVDGAALDERIFAYYDDLDLAWRAALRGWRCEYDSSLTATHVRAGRNAIRALPGRPTRARDQILSVRNRLLVIARCERMPDLARALPWLVPFELARIAYLAVRAPHALRAYVELAREIPPALQARTTIHGSQSPAVLPPLPWRVR